MIAPRPRLWGSAPGNRLSAVVEVLVVLGTLATLALVGAGCRTARPNPGPAPGTSKVAAAPATEVACRACDGLWGRQGLAQVPGCNCRARDAGRTCRDGAECEGQCVLGDHPDRLVAGRATPADGGGPMGYFVGRCSERVTVYGCLRVLPRGSSRRGPVSLDALPPVLCID